MTLDQAKQIVGHERARAYLSLPTYFCRWNAQKAGEENQLELQQAYLVLAQHIIRHRIRRMLSVALAIVVLAFAVLFPRFREFATTLVLLWLWPLIAWIVGMAILLIFCVVFGPIEMLMERWSWKK
jgi:hypothetical protein